MEGCWPRPQQQQARAGAWQQFVCRHAQRRAGRCHSLAVGSSCSSLTSGQQHQLCAGRGVLLQGQQAGPDGLHPDESLRCSCDSNSCRALATPAAVSACVLVPATCNPSPTGAWQTSVMTIVAQCCVLALLAYVPVP